MSQFFCSTWQPSFLFAGRDRVKVIWLVDTPAQQMVVDELAAIVGVDAQQRERQGRLNLYQGTEHMPGRLVPHAADLGPTSGDVGDGERGGEVAVVVPALVADQVDLDEPGPGLVPVGPGPHRN